MRLFKKSKEIALLTEELEQTKEALKNEIEKREEIAKEGDEALIRFHRTVAHEMRIPISIISGYADLLKGDLIAEEDVRREYILKICERADYMTNLFDSLLSDARATAGLNNLVSSPVDVSALVRKTARDLAPAAAKIGIDIRVSGAEEEAPPIIIQSDETKLTKVFYNILENSMKYMGKKGEVNVTVSNLGEKVLIVFKDDGKGMASEEAERIFDMNYQGENKSSGFGLGLHTAKTTVEARGGEIFAKCGIDKGMGIYIYLPIK